MKKKTLFVLIFLSLIFPLFLKGDHLGETTSFFIQSSFDLYQREKIEAILKKITPHGYFYLDKYWFSNLSSFERNRLDNILEELAFEFERKIYPQLRAYFGSEWTPGIDKDSHITILFHPMRKFAGGYFYQGDEYPKTLVAKSNEREIIYLNAQKIFGKRIKAYLAHEFVHLITFNQKYKKYGISEKVWLNEARAEYAPTLVGYNKPFKESYLEERVNLFLNWPNDSLLEWENDSPDYGSINLFIHYLVDHYGIKILIDSLKSDKIGIPSLNDALSKNKIFKDFSQIFLDWTVANILNDCQIKKEYCYLHPNLSSIKIAPLLNYLPKVGNGSLSVSDFTKSWAGNWIKIVGGRENLKFSFKGDPQGNFKVIYIIEKKDGKKEINFLKLDFSAKGSLLIKNFSKDVLSFIFIPISFGEIGRSYKYWWQASVVGLKEIEKEKIEELKKKIKELKREIAYLKALLLRYKTGIFTKFEKDLYFGLLNNFEVKKLQRFLSAFPEIYPEKIISGNFLYLTKKAVSRFQERYRKDILEPADLKEPTGYVGPFTRKKINKLLGF